MPATGPPTGPCTFTTVSNILSSPQQCGNNTGSTLTTGQINLTTGRVVAPKPNWKQFNEIVLFVLIRMSTCQIQSRSNQPSFCHWQFMFSILYYGTALSPTQNCPFPRGIQTPSNTRSYGPTRAHMPNGISISLAVLQDSSPLCRDRQTADTDRQTDHATTSVAIGCIYMLRIYDAA